MTKFQVHVDGKPVGPHFVCWGDALPLLKQHNGGDTFPKRTGPKVEIVRVKVKKGDK